MARTPSTMLPLGTTAPSFELFDPSTTATISLDQVAGTSPLLVMFICNHCPYVIHVMAELGALERDYASRGLSLVAINSNDIDNYPQDGPEEMAKLHKEEGWGFPFLLDADQSVAHAYNAACTPDFYLFNESRELVYRGQLDGSRPHNDVAVTGVDLRGAIEGVFSGAEAPGEQRPSLGCNIKWKEGNEPDYFPRK